MTKHSSYPQDNDIYTTWHEAITIEAFDKLNKWEAGFIVSISEQLEINRPLSQAQANKLEDIYTKYT